MMSKILAPSIWLMSRLSLFYRFTLISVVFMVPILGFSGYLIYEMNRSLNALQGADQSMEALHEVNEVVRSIQDYRDYRAYTRVRDASERYMTRVKELEDQISASIEHLGTRSMDFSGGEVISDQIDMFSKNWDTLLEEDAYHQLMDRQFQHYDELYRQALSLRASVLSNSPIMRADVEHMTQMIEFQMSSLMSAREVLGRVRSYGIFGLSEGQLSYSLSDVMNNLYDDLILKESDFEELLNPPSMFMAIRWAMFIQMS